jgi:hypothetical protein
LIFNFTLNIFQQKNSFRLIADTFALTFIYRYRHHIILRFQNEHSLKSYGYKQGRQRWYTCIFQHSFTEFMQPALLVMYEQWRPIWDRTLGDFDRDLNDERVDIVGGAEKLIREAVDEFKKRFLEEAAPNTPTWAAADILIKIKGLKLLFGLQKSVFPVSKLEEFYSELELEGDENFLRSIWEIQKIHRKISNERGSSWQRQISKLTDEIVSFGKYDVENGNIMCELFLVRAGY